MLDEPTEDEADRPEVEESKALFECVLPVEAIGPSPDDDDDEEDDAEIDDEEDKE